MSHKITTLTDVGRKNYLKLHLAIAFLQRLLAYFDTFMYTHPCTDTQRYIMYISAHRYAYKHEIYYKDIGIVIFTGTVVF